MQEKADAYEAAGELECESRKRDNQSFHEQHQAADTEAGTRL